MTFMVITVAAAVLVAAAGVLALGYQVIRAAHAGPRQGANLASRGHRRPGLEGLILRVLTRAIRLMLRLGIRMGPMMMLTVRGRTSGLARSNPVDVFAQDGRHWLIATHDANASWVLNLRAAGGGYLALGRRGYTFTATEVPLEEAGAVLQRVLSPRLGRPVAGLVLRQTIGVAPDAPAADFARAASAHPVFEIAMIPASSSPADTGAARTGAARTGAARTGAVGTGAAGVSGAARPRGALVVIALGLVIAAAHATLGATGVMSRAQWVSGVVLGLMIAGIANHVRIFGRR